jgi:MFS family permease
MSAKKRFGSVAVAGVTFQAGSSAIDSATIMSALVFQLTGSPFAVGFVPAILRFGWLFPQLFVGFFVQKKGSSMAYYRIGAFGRALAIGFLALALFVGSDFPPLHLFVVVLCVWTIYAGVSGIVAVPYNDIVARSITPDFRSRLLATRFFGGGIVALGVVVAADFFVGTHEFPISYAAIFALASILMLISSTVFSAMRKPVVSSVTQIQPTFVLYLVEGFSVFRCDHRFKVFVYAQWCGGAVLMAMPFYVIQASSNGVSLEDVAILLGAQTLGALVSNPLWGWWGDKLGKASLLRAISFFRIFPPMIALILSISAGYPSEWSFQIFIGLFFLLGALSNGLTIAVIGYLMEISPDGKRPAYTGYFNAITAPAFLLPVLAGGLATVFSLWVVFMASMIAAGLQLFFLSRLHDQCDH